MGSIGSFFVELGVKAETVKVKDFVKSIGEIPLSVAAAVGALAGIDLGFISFTNHILDTANALSDFHAETGLSMEMLGRWQNVAKTVGVSGDTVAASITGIADAIVQVTKFGNSGPAVAFGRLGISNFASQSPFEIMPELRKKYKTMDPNEFRALASQIGVSPKMDRVFEMSDAKFNKWFAMGPTLKNADIQAANDFTAAIAQFKTTVEQSLVLAFKEVEPYMAGLSENLAEFIKRMAPFLAGSAGVLGSTLGGIAHPTTVPHKVHDFWNEKFGPFHWSNFRNPFSLTEEQMRIPANNITVNQHIHGVTDGADADSVGSQHLQREIVKAAKQIQRNR